LGTTLNCHFGWHLRAAGMVAFLLDPRKGLDDPLDLWG
jgi:hypothetical protein